MEQCTQFVLLFLGILLPSRFFYYECKKLDGYNFPVYSTKLCPRNETEWNERSTAINCTEKNGYVCLPNENITELLEFCYMYPFILVQEDICLFLSKRNSALYPYNCTGFLQGCPNSSLVSYRLFENSYCTSIGNGCFLAEPSCKGLTSTTNIQEATYHNLETNNVSVLFGTTVGLQDAREHISLETKNGLPIIGTTVGIFFIIFLVCAVCYLFFNDRKGNQICKRVEDEENNEEELSPFISQRENDKKEFNEKGNQICKRTEDEKNNEEQLSPFISQRENDIKEIDEKGNQICKRIDNVENQEQKEYEINELSVEENDICQITYDVENENEQKQSSSCRNKLSIKELPVDQGIIGEWEKDNTLFVETNASKKVERLTKKQNLVIVMGHPGSGKSAVLHHIALKHRSQGWNVKPINKVTDIMQFMNSSEMNLDRRTVFVWNDPIGKETFDEIEYNSWRKHEDNLKACLNKVKLLLSCRNYILSDERVRGLLKDKSYIVDITENQFKLSNSEKEKMLIRHSFRKSFPREEMTKIVQTDAYFPLLCKLYFSPENKQRDILRFFTEPVDCFENEIRNFKTTCKEKYCALVLLVLFNNKLCIADIRDSLISKETYELALELCGMDKNTALHTIKDTLETLLGFFVRKNEDTYHFYHDFVMEVTSFVLGNDYPLDIIKLADIGFLRKRVKLKGCNDLIDQFTIYLNDKYIDALGNRLFNEVFGDRLLEVVLNPCLRNEKVIQAFKNELESHPEKLTMLLEKKKIKIDNEDAHQTSDHLFLSKLAFLSLEEKISPLNAIIIFCDTTLSLYCLNLLQQIIPHNFKGNSIFSSVCCNGSKDVFTLFVNDNLGEYLSEKWKFLFPIHIASAFNNNEILLELLQVGGNVNQKTTNDNYWTPLTLAAGIDTEISQPKRNDTVQLLIKNGADINLCKKNGASPLYIACIEGHDSIVKILLRQGASINSYSQDGGSLLCKACQEGQRTAVKTLLRNGADVNILAKDGSSPLNIACRKGLYEIVRVLLKYDANVNLCDKNGTSPLFIACQYKKHLIVLCLLMYGADINSCKEDGTSPLYVACKEGHTLVVSILLKKGANKDLCKKNGESPLFIACQKGHDKVVQKLLGEGADTNRCTDDGVSPLNVACQEKHEDIVKHLLSYRAKVNLCAGNGTSPLITACKSGHDGIVQFLLNNGAEINLCDKYGASPFYMACKHGHDIIAQLLVNKGADINLSSSNEY